MRVFLDGLHSTLLKEELNIINELKFDDPHSIFITNTKLELSPNKLMGGIEEFFDFEGLE